MPNAGFIRGKPLNDMGAIDAIDEPVLTLEQKRELLDAEIKRLLLAAKAAQDYNRLTGLVQPEED